MISTLMGWIYLQYSLQLGALVHWHHARKDVTLVHEVQYVEGHLWGTCSLFDLIKIGTTEYIIIQTLNQKVITSLEHDTWRRRELCSMKGTVSQTSYGINEQTRMYQQFSMKCYTRFAFWTILVAQKVTALYYLLSPGTEGSDPFGIAEI